MKKLAIAIALVLLVGAFVMAGDVVITGSATTSAGYNLDTEAYGLLSEVSSDATIVLGAADGESMGEGEWYGVITLTGASIGTGSTVLDVYSNDDDGANLDDDLIVDADSDGNANYVTMPFVITVPTVAAKITDGNLYAMLQSEASFAADYVVGVEDDAADYSASSVSGSLTFGGMFGPATLALELGTAGNYTDAAPTDGTELGFTLGLDVAPLTVDAAFAGGFGYVADQDMAFGLQVAADVAPATITAAFDYNMPAVGDATMEVGAGVAAVLSPVTVGLDVYYGQDSADTEVDTDVAFSTGYAADAITADVTVSAYDIASDLVWKGALDLTYAVNSGVALAAGMGYDSGNVMSAYANVALTEVVDNVTFTLGWENADDLTDVAGDSADVLGQVVLGAKIAY